MLVDCKWGAVLDRQWAAAHHKVIHTHLHITHALTTGGSGGDERRGLLVG